MKYKRVIFIGICAVLFVVVFSIYFQTVNHDFINFDDPVYVTQNQNVKAGLSFSGVRWAFSSFDAGNWHPITWISHMLDVELFGMRASGHHLSSVFFHSLNTLLVFILFYLLPLFPQASLRIGVALLVAFIFGMHPQRVESVAWVAERKDVLSAFFWFLTLIWYGQYVMKLKLKAYSFALVSFIFGLMSKPMLVTLPFVLLLFDYWPYQRLKLPLKNHRKVLLEKIPFFLVTVLSAVLTILAQKRSGAVGSVDILPLTYRVGNACYSYVRYLGKLFWPLDLSVYYPYIKVHKLLQPAIWSGIFLMLFTGFCVTQGKKRPWLVTGWFWFIGTLVPVIGLIQVGAQSMADRYTYIPHIGIYLMICMLFFSFLTSAKPVYQRVMGMAFLILAITMSFLTFQQTGHWKNSFTLYEHSLKITPESSLIHNNLGGSYFYRKDYEKAVVHFQKAVENKPTYQEALANLGTGYIFLRKYDKAYAAFKRLLLLNPYYIAAYNNFGLACIKTSRYTEALDWLLRKYRLTPNDKNTCCNLGIAYYENGEYSISKTYLLKAINIQPSFPLVHYYLVLNFLKLDDKLGAQMHYRILKKMKSKYVSELKELENE